MGLQYLITIVPFEADYLLHQDDIPTLQILLTYGHSPRHNSRLHQHRHDLG